MKSSACSRAPGVEPRGLGFRNLGFRGLGFRVYLWIQEPTVVRVRPCNEEVKTYYFVGFGATGRVQGAEPIERLSWIAAFVNALSAVI